ncbi:hypothetical protein DID88_000088 [Monilinia fructigena]|uniref:ABC transmembrane type-1 domain-containing protein n=1 Tax=Monilinia fructigena TaxID=38457 RepID=A0A395IIW3_9HELO|nr:hypothetical protein DID88_000088 [Monilinia fructigena]
MSNNLSNFDIPIENFGPAQPVGFDFTPLFENVFLSIVPSVILLLLLPIRMWRLQGQPRKANSSFLHSNKLLFLGVFTIMQTIYLVMSTTGSKRLKSQSTITAAALQLADALGLCALSHLEHLHSVRPSALINAWLLLTLLFDMARARTLWLDYTDTSAAAVFTSALSVKIIVIITEAIEKRHILLDRYRHTSPEVTSGIYSRSFFWWLNNLMTTGFQRIIRNEDLYPIDEKMSSQYLYARAQNTWDRCDHTRSHILLWSTLKATRGAFAFGILPRLCIIGFRYAQPFLLQRTVGFANDESQPNSIGWGLTGAFGLVFLGLAVLNGTYYHMAYRFNTAVRGSLVSLIYAKTVDVSITALDESVAVTLMANDTSAICKCFTHIHELWAVPIELSIAMYLLYRQLGLAFLAPCSVALVCTAGILTMAKWMGNAQKIWIRGIQTRIDVTASMLGSMKAVRMLGFTDSLTTMVQSLRVKEVYLSQLFRRLLCGRVFLANSTGIMSPLVTFTVFVVSANLTGRTLSTSTAYTALSLIALLAEPMNTLLSTIPEVNAAIACFERIEAFMLSDARKDHRLPLGVPQESPAMGGLTTRVGSGGISLSGGQKQRLALARAVAVAVEGNEANPYWLGIYGMLSGVSLIGFVAGVCHLVLYMMPKSAKVLHQRLLDSVMGAPLFFFTATDTGTTTNRFSQDMSILDGDLPYAIVDLSISIVQAIMGAVLMSLSAGYFAATIPVVGLGVWVLQKFYLRTSRQIRLLDLEAKSPLYSHFIETLSGLTTIRAFGWTEKFREQNLTLLDTSQKPYYLLFCIQRWLGLVLDLIVTALAVILMILIVKLRANISPGYVGLALLNVMTFNEALAQIIKNWTNMETAVGAVSRLKNFSAITASENLPRKKLDPCQRIGQNLALLTSGM